MYKELIGNIWIKSITCEIGGSGRSVIVDGGASKTAGAWVCASRGEL